MKPTISLILPLVLLAGASLWLLQTLSPADFAAPSRSTNAITSPETINVPPRNFEYRDPVRYIENELPQISPLVHIKLQTPLSVTKNLITNGQYNACVAAEYCAPALGAQSSISDHPVVGINFEMAQSYARWLSVQTGENWRLPTAVEWAQFAGDKYVDPEKDIQSDPNNPAVAWLSEYRSLSQSKNETTRQSLRPVGLFGPNNLGVNDVAENVWVWTSTCYERINKNSAGVRARATSCAVRIVEGAHRTYLSVVIATPQGGGCSVGDPPTHLGIRLVKSAVKPDVWFGLRHLFPFA